MIFLRIWPLKSTKFQAWRSAGRRKTLVELCTNRSWIWIRAKLWIFWPWIWRLGIFIEKRSTTLNSLWLVLLCIWCSPTYIISKAIWYRCLIIKVKSLRLLIIKVKSLRLLRLLLRPANTFRNLVLTLSFWLIYLLILLIWPANTFRILILILILSLIYLWRLGPSNILSLAINTSTSKIKSLRLLWFFDILLVKERFWLILRLKLLLWCIVLLSFKSKFRFHFFLY